MKNSQNMPELNNKHLANMVKGWRNSQYPASTENIMSPGIWVCLFFWLFSLSDGFGICFDPVCRWVLVCCCLQQPCVHYLPDALGRVVCRCFIDMPNPFLPLRGPALYKDDRWYVLRLCSLPINWHGEEWFRMNVEKNSFHVKQTCSEL